MKILAALVASVALVTVASPASAEWAKIPAVAPAQALNLRAEIMGNTDFCILRSDGGPQNCEHVQETQVVKGLAVAYDGRDTVLFMSHEGYFIAVNADAVGVTYKGCALTMASYLSRSFCPGVK